MFLAADVGNTNITFGIFDNSKITKTFRLTSDINISEEEYISLILSNTMSFEITSAVIGSVVEGLGEKIKTCIDKVFNIKTFFKNYLLFDKFFWQSQ